MAKARKRQQKEQRQAIRKDVKAAVKDNSLTVKEATALRRHGMKAVNPLAARLNRGLQIEMEKGAGRQLGLRRRAGQLTFDPRAFSQKSTSYDPVYGGGFDGGGARPMQMSTTWQTRMNAPGGPGTGAWVVVGYRKDKAGKDIPIYGHTRPARKGGGKKKAPAEAYGASGESAAGPFQQTVQQAVDPYADLLYQQAQDALGQMDYYDQMLAEMLGGMNSLATTGPGAGYTVGITTPEGPTNTYTTDVLGRRLPEASTLSVSLA